MKKSVRIRKAGPGEKPGYYNKTANFLNKALPKAKMGMQMNSNNNMQERLKVIMLDTYANLRDGMEPNMVFESLVTKYGVDQEMAFQIINTVMTKLAQQGHKDPAYLNQDEEEDDYANNNNPQTPEPAKPATPNVGTPNEDEELALSESDMASGVDPGTEEYAQEGAFQYGGYYDDGGELDYDYPNYFDNADSTEQTILDQYSNPGQLSTEDQIPFDLSRLIKFTPGAQNFPQTPDLNYYLGNYRGVADESSIPTDLLPANKHGGLHKFAGGGPGKGKGKRGRPRKEKTPTETEAPAPGTTSTEIPVVENTGPQRIVTPQETVTAPSTWQKYQNFYARKNPLSDRGVVGRQVENLGTLINTVRPQNWREKWRAQVAPSTTTTKIITDINALIENDKYEPSVLQKNTDGSFNTGLGFNLDPSLADFLLKNTEQLDALLAKGKKKSAELDLDKLSELRNTGIPGSISPELDFLSIHRQNNGKLKFTKDENGLFKVEIVSEVPTRLKGYKKKALTIKDELIIDPKTKEIIDPKTKLPLETVDKNYYMGNQLNWYNSPYRFPFTAKYPGLDLSTYPQIISENPLKKEPVSGWNVARNMIGKPMVFSPMSLPFTYPGFAARSKFYPNASNIKTQFLGAQREIGPQAPGGMTFGDQPFGAQYADYNLLKNRNFQTGANFLKYAGILGGLGYLGYNQFLSQPDKDDISDKGQKESILKENINLEGRGRVGNDPTFGVTRSGYDKDSMLIENGDTIHNKIWATPAPDYKKGGAQKKQFVKNVMSKFAPGGEFGKGNRMDNLKNDVTKKKSNFVGTLKKQSDKVATEELYNAVQKSGDPQLMNIFMGQDQNPAQQMQQQFAEHGGFIDMDSKNPLTKFISGGDEADFYEPYSLPEANNGHIVPGGSGGQYILGKMPPGGEGGQLLDLDDPSLIKDHWGKSCPPGSVWSEKYQQCVPLMKTVYKPRVVQGRPSMASTLLPWNPIFKSYLTNAPKMSRRDNPYSRKNLRQFSKDFGREDRYRVLPMLRARDSGRGEPKMGYNMRQFLIRSLPFGALLQPKYANGGPAPIDFTSNEDDQTNLQPSSSWSDMQSFNAPAPNAPQQMQDQNAELTKYTVDPIMDDRQYLQPVGAANPAQFVPDSGNQDQKNDTNYYDPTQYRKVTTMDGEAFNNVFNAGLNATSGFINNLQNNPRSLATTYQATNLLRQVPISNQTDMGDQQDIGQNIGFRGPEQGSERNSRATFGNYPGAATGGFLAYGGFLEDGGYTDPYMEEEEVYMTPEELQQFLKAGGQVEYL